MDECVVDVEVVFIDDLFDCVCCEGLVLCFNNDVVGIFDLVLVVRVDKVNIDWYMVLDLLIDYFGLCCVCDFVVWCEVCGLLSEQVGCLVSFGYMCDFYVCMYGFFVQCVDCVYDFSELSWWMILQLLLLLLIDGFSCNDVDVFIGEQRICYNVIVLQNFLFWWWIIDFYFFCCVVCIVLWYIWCCVQQSVLCEDFL